MFIHGDPLVSHALGDDFLAEWMDRLRRAFIRIDGDGHAKILVRRNDGIAEYAQLSIAHDGVVDVAVTVVSG